MPERNGAKHAHDKREYNEEAEMRTRVPSISQRGFSHHITPLNDNNHSAKAKTMPRRPEEDGAVRDIAQQVDWRASLGQKKQQQLSARLSFKAKKEARIQGKWNAGSQNGDAAA